MERDLMLDAPTLQKLIDPLFPGLMGVRILEATPERVVAEMTVRPDLCTAGGIMHGGAYMAFADTLGALGTVVNLTEAHDDDRLAHEVHGRRQDEHDGARRERGLAPRPHDDGVADCDHQC